VSQFLYENFPWCAGLFVGEGSIGVNNERKKTGRLYRCLSLRLKMLDLAAVEKFAATFATKVYYLGRNGLAKSHFRSDDQKLGLVSVAARKAETICRALYPYLWDTHKGCQMREAFSKVALTLPLEGTTENLTVTNTSQDRDLSSFQWCAGLFVGEGSIGAYSYDNGSGRRYTYLTIQLGMLDVAAVERFAATVESNLWYGRYRYDTNRFFPRAHARARTAEAICRTLYPYLRETGKGQQIREAFAKVGLTLADDGSGESLPRRNGLLGRTFSEIHRRKISEAMKRYWARRRAQN
jgi:hypothetical protein